MISHEWAHQAQLPESAVSHPLNDRKQLKNPVFRRRIPLFECEPGCHDCCGPVTALSEEMARLPLPGEPVRAAALAECNCPHLGPDDCQVYAERPLVCRLFGTTPRLPCPNGKRPEVMVAPGLSKKYFNTLPRCVMCCFDQIIVTVRLPECYINDQCITIRGGLVTLS